MATAETIEATLTEMGFSLESRLTCDDFDGREGDSHWSVKIGINGRTYTTEYHMGCAHRHYRNGKPIVLPYQCLTIDRSEKNKRSLPDKPRLADVVYSVVSDAQGVANCGGFEDWCADFGYDNDSIKAKVTYDACCASFLRLRQLCNLDELSELFQDY